MRRFAKPLYGQKLYRGFESPPLRQQVSTAEKLCYVAPEISEKGRLFAVSPQQAGLEKMANELRHSRCSGFSPEPPWAVRFQEPSRANAWRSQTEHSANPT